MTPEDHYQRARNQGGWVDRSGRTRLEISGPDRAKFLHNLVTSDIKRLANGSGVEAFVTSPQGKTIAYLTILATDHTILVRTEPESLEGLLPHLQKYGVFDDVEIRDVSASTFEAHLIGPGIDRIAQTLGLEPVPAGPLANASVMVEGVQVRVVCESPTGSPGLTLVGPSEALGAIRVLLDREDLAEIDPPTFEVLRIEAGTPASGRDVLPNNLPQEVGRDSLAINFVKGCYLGQETVARLDALGHVNKILKGIRIMGEVVPDVGAALLFEGKTVGSITSTAWSPGWGGPVALAYVRVAQAGAGSDLTLENEGRAVVVDLPMLPPHPHPQPL